MFVLLSNPLGGQPIRLMSFPFADRLDLETTTHSRGNASLRIGLPTAEESTNLSAEQPRDNFTEVAVYTRRLKYLEVLIFSRFAEFHEFLKRV